MALGLSLNEAKTLVKDARRESFDFLGDTLGPRHFLEGGRWYLGAAPSRKSVQRIKTKVSDFAVRRRGGERTIGTRASMTQTSAGRWTSYRISSRTTLPYPDVVDDCTRECLALVTDTSLSGTGWPGYSTD